MFLQLPGFFGHPFGSVVVIVDHVIHVRRRAYGEGGDAGLSRCHLGPDLVQRVYAVADKVRPKVPDAPISLHATQPL